MQISNVLQHIDVLCLCPHIRVLIALGWNNLPVYLSHPRTWLSLDGRGVRVLLTSVSLAPAHGCTFTTWQVKTCEKTLKASWKSLHNLQTSWRDHRHKKKSPLSNSVLNRCCINNFLHWDVQTYNKQFPAVQHENETPRRKTQCAFIQIYVAMKPSCKTNVPWNTPRGKRF